MKKILVIYSAEAGHVATTHQYVDAFRRHSRFKTDYLCIEQCPAEPVDLSRYDAILMSYCAGFALKGYQPDSMPKSLRDALATYCGPKLVALQDEYDRTDRLREELRRIGSTVILTCVPQQSLDYVYPRSMFPSVRFVTVLTGYVADDLLMVEDIRPLAERPIVVGYRGRDLGARYGELARQKAQIGLRLREACLTRGIPCDIAVDEESRIYGSAWFDFLKSCRVMLGSESGSNVFDFDGSVTNRYKEMQAADPKLSYEEFQPFIAEREKEIDMAQISPRVFEAAATRTALVMFRGRYSGLLEPDVHYIPLELDYSNLDDVLERIGDVSGLEVMIERAHRDLIASGANSYQTFVQRIDQILEPEMRKRPHPTVNRSKPPLNSRLLTRMPLGHDPYLRDQLRRARETCEQQTVHLTAEYQNVDRLLAEVRSYGEAVKQVEEEKSKLEAEMLRRHLESVFVSNNWTLRAVPRLLARALRAAVRKVGIDWKALGPRWRKQRDT